MAAAATSPAGPKPSPDELEDWNYLHDVMSQFHENFRQCFREIYSHTTNDNAWRDEFCSLSSFLRFAESFFIGLSNHHGIEEARLFPILAEKMPEFRGDKHPDEHRKIHAGLDKYGEYVKECKLDSSKYSASKLREIMDSFEKILFYHLDAEVKSLEYENMSKYWTLDEVRNKILRF
ncbi:hypothetical protein BT69DRAFT_1231890 [Atractiella rhizophila]|nr:hypothetical protein BT69DRAFT_1231890 [Atractiella rhizophila]